MPCDNPILFLPWGAVALQLKQKQIIHSLSSHTVGAGWASGSALGSGHPQ